MTTTFNVKLVPYGPVYPDEEVSAVDVVINVEVASAVTAFEVAELKFVSPPYTAVSVCVTVDVTSGRTLAEDDTAVPAVANEPANVAAPLALSVPVPIFVVPSMNETVPVATVEDVLVTAALSATVPSVGEEAVFVSVTVGRILLVSIAFEVAVLKFVSPAYTAVRMCPAPDV